MQKKYNIVVTIFNHNHNEDAEILLNEFSKKYLTYVLDSGSTIKNDKFIQYDNIYYNGLVNESYKLLINSNCDYLLLITSDVKICDFNELFDAIDSIINNNDVGLYSPSVTYDSKAHKHCKCDDTDKLRKVKFIEGYFSLINKLIIDKVCPIDLDVNKFGWCTDVLLGYYSNLLNLNNYIDNSIKIYHPDDTGYDTNFALKQMNDNINLIGDEFRCFFYNAINNGEY